MRFKRLGLTTALILGWGIVETIANRVATLVSGEAAVHQFDNSDTSYVFSSTIMEYVHGEGISFGIFLILLLLIWWKPIENFVACEKDHTHE